MHPVAVYLGCLPGVLGVTSRKGVRDLGYRRRSYDRGPREMHKAICSDCGKECEVPFKPTEGRPVYCRECYQKHRRPF
ncbi:DNA-directed RNA polymerase [Candidatus Bathyarchaeota archaeon]|nr:MAG: DNA-directed RNA polymerase [Candidatus Bathyarchaeota archaeon]